MALSPSVVCVVMSMLVWVCKPVVAEAQSALLTGVAVVLALAVTLLSLF
jgi:hypothetical protein